MEIEEGEDDERLYEELEQEESEEGRRELIEEAELYNLTDHWRIRSSEGDGFHIGWQPALHHSSVKQRTDFFVVPSIIISHNNFSSSFLRHNSMKGTGGIIIDNCHSVMIKK